MHEHGWLLMVRFMLVVLRYVADNSMRLPRDTEQLHDELEKLETELNRRVG